VAFLVMKFIGTKGEREMKRLGPWLVMGALCAFAAGGVLAAESEKETNKDTVKQEAKEAEEDDEQSERETSLDRIPEAARRAILEEAAGHDVLEVDEVVVEGNTFYEAEWIAGELEVEVRVSPEGEIVGRESEAAESESEDDGD